ncbi:hypothetical protein ERW51_06385 [Aliivibrio finisterrensis]|uniref:hypothetical protein n=1 Tax=Aliivibrio finisterrensis TaxID=511998 RepID=UPI00101FD511|nr:hypothetical protein [Aliivibrio finisterrensis]RYU68789.1 hypothetical protein ERW54_08425 [Aliivibrio finisterrensis]RYU72805.1 hypothetical protein ERW51_06385 [Aliivibrio finisterrensis]RYU75212.1 hypothetical protein ERW48_09445 [Aliivibrio finisterrensis]
MRVTNCLYLGFVLCNAPLAMAELETTVVVKGDKFVYEGDISGGANETLLSLYKNNGQIKTLEIKSYGGEINLGMDLGEFVYKNNLTVEVNDYCFSSCANYVFPSGKRKLISNRAVIGFHGGASSNEFDDSEFEKELASLSIQQREETLNEVANYMKDSVKREDAFYSMIGVDQRITTLGQSDDFSQFDEGGYDGWYYSISALNKLGVDNVFLIGPPVEYKPIRSDLTLFEIDADKF